MIDIVDRLLEAALGLVLVGAVLWDVFETVVVPRPAPSRFRIARNLTRQGWRLARTVSLRSENGLRREGVLGVFAPALVILLLVVWVTVLVLGYGLLLFALRDEIQPVPVNLGEAVYTAGTSLLTIGFGDFVATGGPARLVLLVAAGTGLGVVALVITYLFSLYGAFQRREVPVVTLDARAGAPPSGVALLETYAQLGMVPELPALFGEWEIWAAEVLDSHVAYPILAYFRSSHDNESWISSLGAVLDASTLVMTAVDGVPRGHAQMFFAMGNHLVEDISNFFHFPMLPDAGVERSEFDTARERLAAAGYELADAEAAWSKFGAKRSMYASRLNLLAEYWVSPPSLWIGDRAPWIHHMVPGIAAASPAIATTTLLDPGQPRAKPATVDPAMVGGASLAEPSSAADQPASAEPAAAAPAATVAEAADPPDAAPMLDALATMTTPVVTAAASNGAAAEQTNGSRRAGRAPMPVEVASSDPPAQTSRSRGRTGRPSARNGSAEAIGEAAHDPDQAGEAATDPLADGPGDDQDDVASLPAAVIDDLLHAPVDTAKLVEIPTMTFFMVDGHGDPNTSPQFQHAMQALYGATYTLQFALKRLGVDTGRVPPLEGLWRRDDIEAFRNRDMDDVTWTLTMRVPGGATTIQVEAAIRELARKRGESAVTGLRVERFAEGLAAQIMHVGPYATEEPTIERLHAFIVAGGFAFNGRHHEIYLSDPRTTAPERIRTLIRHPVAAPEPRTGGRRAAAAS